MRTADLRDILLKMSTCEIKSLAEKSGVSLRAIWLIRAQYAAAHKVMDEALKPTCDQLQASAHDLYLAMINAELSADGAAATAADPEASA